MDFRVELRKAQESRTIVRVSRRYSFSSYLPGYVKAVSDELVALSVIACGVTYDGFAVLRLKDIRKVQIPGEWAEFSERALERRGEQPPDLELDLSSWQTVIESSGQTYPIARFQFYDESEFDSEETCGKVVEINDEIVRIRPIDPGAAWETSEEFYSLSLLSRMKFGSLLDVMLGELAHEKPKPGQIEDSHGSADIF